MKKTICLAAVAIFNLLVITTVCYAQEVKPDTVKTGIYITSVHDIDFKQKEYTVTFWLWLKYKNKDFDFYRTLRCLWPKPFQGLLLLLTAQTAKYIY